jgi:hypothetical protein
MGHDAISAFCFLVDAIYEAPPRHCARAMITRLVMDVALYALAY